MDKSNWARPKFILLLTTARNPNRTQHLQMENASDGYKRKKKDRKKRKKKKSSGILWVDQSIASYLDVIIYCSSSFESRCLSMAWDGYLFKSIDFFPNSLMYILLCFSITKLLHSFVVRYIITDFGAF